MLKKYVAALLAGATVVGAAAQTAVPNIAAGLALALSSAPATAQTQPSTPLCLTMPNGAPRIVIGQGVGYSQSLSTSSNTLLNMAHNNARNDWANKTQAYGTGYGDWNRAANTNVRSSSRRAGFYTTWTVIYTGQPCRPQ